MSEEGQSIRASTRETDDLGELESLKAQMETITKLLAEKLLTDSAIIEERRQAKRLDGENEKLTLTDESGIKGAKLKNPVIIEEEGNEQKPLNATFDHIEKPPGVIQMALHDYPGQDDQWGYGHEQLKVVAQWKEQIDKEMSLRLQEIKAMKGDDYFDLIDINQLGLGPSIIVPMGFQMPQFQKFDGSSDPIYHLKTYLAKMAIWSRDENFLMGLFHESLSGPAFRWFMQLEERDKKDWQGFMRLFVKNYSFNLDIALTREDIRNMRKNSDETFKQYAQRWRIQAAQVKPPLSPAELCNYFLNTLEGAFMNAMVGCPYTDFLSIVSAGERVEEMIRSGRIASDIKEEGSSGHKKGFQAKKKESEVHQLQHQTSVFNQPQSPPYHNYPTLPIHPYSIPFYPPLPYQFSIQSPSTSIHSVAGSLGQPNYTPQKHDQSPNPQTQNTRPPRDDRPFPNFNMSKQELMDKLLKVGLIAIQPLPPLQPPYPKWYNPEVSCTYHRGTRGHTIDNCFGFRRTVLALLDKNTISLETLKAPNVQSNPLPNHGDHKLVGAIEVDTNILMIDRKYPMALNTPVITFSIPAPFEYEDSHNVPWNYETKVSTGEGFENPFEQGDTIRSENPYVLAEQKRNKVKKMELTLEEVKSDNGEEGEFLKILKQSEYSVTQQLKHGPSRISLFTLILSSDDHRKALQDVLNTAFVRTDITTEAMVNMVDPLKHTNQISFSEDEIAPSSREGPQALHIVVQCFNLLIAKVLIDGGSGLNVLPYKTLKQLPVKNTEIKDTPITVRAFDGSASKTIGRLELPVQIGPTVFSIEFEVMDISPSYNMLLGRPWIHKAKAVPSTLHQKVKFISEGSIVSVKGEDDILLMRTVSVPYIEGPDMVVDGAHHSFEIVKGITSERNEDEINKKSFANHYMKKCGYKDGCGLGINLQGIIEPIVLIDNHHRKGLGYENSFSNNFADGLVLNEDSSPL